MSTKLVAAFLAAVLLVPVSQARQDDLQKKLDARVSIDFTGGLTKGLALLREKTGIEVRVDPKAVEKKNLDHEARLQLGDVRAASAIAWMARLYGLSYEIQSDHVLFWLPEGNERRVIDISGVVRPITWSSAPRIALLTNMSGVSVTSMEESDRSPASEELGEVLKSHVEPGTWEGEFGIETLPGSKMLVTHTAPTVRRIERLLDVLRHAGPATVTFEADLVEADETLLKAAKGTGSASLDGEATKALQEVMKGLRKSPKSLSFSIPCHEGQRAHSMALGQKSALQGTPGHEQVVTYSEASVLSVEPCVSPDGRTIRTQIGLQTGRSAEHVTQIGGGKMDLPETGLTTLETTIEIPNGGSILFLLPRRCEESARPQALWVRASASAPARVASLEEEDASAASLWKKLDSAKPIDVSMEGATTDQMIAFFRQATGLNFVADPTLDTQLGGTLHAKRIQPRLALETILSPHDVKLVPYAEAFLLTHSTGGPGKLQLYIESLRDLGSQPTDVSLGEEGLKVAMRLEDFVNIIQKGLPKQTWDDDHTLSVTRDGLLVVRQTPEAVDEVRKFLGTLRKRTGGMISMRFDLIQIKESQVPAEALLTEEQAEKLISEAAKTGGAGAEAITLRGFAGHRLGAAWGRARSYLSSYDEKKEGEPAFESAVAQSTVSVRAEAMGREVALELSAHFQCIDEISTRTIRKYEFQVPSTSTYDAKTSFTMSPDKTAVVKLTGTRDEGGEKTMRLLLIRVTPAP